MSKKPVKGEYLEVLLRSPRTIFSSKDASLLWQEAGRQTVTSRLNKYFKAGKLIRVCHGIYAKDKNYNPLELATKIYTPSYISFETVLGSAGVTFQYYGNIFVASYVTREIETDGNRISFIRMKDYVLTDTTGIEHDGDVAMATPERAFLDRIYVSWDYHFDNLDVLNWDKVFSILPIYRNKTMNKKVAKYFKYYQENK
ncbi:MAG: hypothetical protein Q8P32_05125 [Candidatus Komeilibacteria bacterium]|nr:hypothetical protein [Candidatus Komeilibacteria bacterium]